MAKVNVFLISDDLFFYEGVKAILDDMAGVSVRLMKVDLLIYYLRIEDIQEDDVFIVAKNLIGNMLSALIILDYYSANIILLNSYGNQSKAVGCFLRHLPDRVNAEGIISSVNNHALLKLPKMWSLSYSETEVMSHRLRGLSVKNINFLFSINVKTIYTHQRNGLAKMGAKSFTNLYRLNGLPYNY
ncbi:helix-turn-helix transcriptional regulator [Serratia fonticola]|uniref:helix-turn-helix transcriptional regulator n=1 Tax=Serratia fonticola TaxID=47917 RepID=UPI003AF36D63